MEFGSMEKRNESTLCMIVMSTTNEHYACIQGKVVDVTAGAKMVLIWKGNEKKKRKKDLIPMLTSKCYGSNEVFLP